MTDGEARHKSVDAVFASHEVVDHGRREYVRGDVTTNGFKGFFTRVKRTSIDTHHAVSREHLHRYMDGIAFVYNTRALNDGERTALLVQKADGKRLTYREPIRQAG